MKIKDIEMEIQESLANLPFSALPPELAGLRHVPVDKFDAHVSIRHLKNINKGRKIRGDADAAYFDPNTCELVIRFVPVEASVQEEAPAETVEAGGAPGPDHQDATPADFALDRDMDQLVEHLKGVEADMPFVSLKWFRDQALPRSGLDWARDPRSNGALLRRAIEERLVLTSQVPNPEQPFYPVTAIRVNRTHPRYQGGRVSSGVYFHPIQIRGGPISETVIEDRR